LHAKKRPTHRDVAELAGVSPAVVSYVINGGPRGTSAEARQRVLDAIEALSYHPSAAARGLRMQQTHTIGFISYDPHPLDAFFAPYNAGVLTGLTLALLAQRRYILPFPVGMDEDLRGLDELLYGGRLDGVVVRLSQVPPFTDPILERVAKAGIPCVCIERAGSDRFGFSSVTYDDEAGGYDATAYLLTRGYRRIAHIMGDPRMVSAKDREAGYKRALVEAGVPVDEDLIQGDSWRPADGATATRKLLAMEHAPGAIFAANDQLALSVIEVAREIGMHVPDDIAVVGFDDVPLAQELIPPLTTVRIPFAELGRRAADLVLQNVQGELRECRAETVPLKLIRRDSA